MSLYPSLEDMKVDQMAQAQRQHNAAITGTAPAPDAPAGGYPAGYVAAPSYSPATTQRREHISSLYPSLGDEYMGLDISSTTMQHHIPEWSVVPVAPQTVALPTTSGPITNESGIVGYKRAEVKHGVREVVLCKNADGKVGLRLHSVNKGIFAALVQRGTPAALAGIRFGDQILSIDDKVLAGYSKEKAMEVIKKGNPKRITMAIRDRPFERALTLHKDSTGHVGFVYKKGEITSLVKDSSAARNGMLTGHNLVEVDGQNVVGVDDSEIKRILNAAPNTITVTIMPTFVYEHMMKQMSSVLLKKMDHSIPEI